VLIYSNEGDKDMLRSVDIELSIIKQLSSPFLPYLYAEMGTSRHRIAVLKFVEGIRLRDVMTLHAEELNEDVLRVYMGCILLALSFMHTHEMLYLNLNPDSVYIDAEGLPKLIQFHGSQQLLEIHRPSLYVTQYSAPEVSDPNANLNVESDFWSLGVLLFECLAGAIKYPIQNLTEKAIKKTLRNPNFNTRVTSSAVSLLKHLIFERDKYELTCETIMEHDWFGTVDWNRLRGRVSPIKLYRPSRQDMGLVTLVASAVDVTLAEYVRADLGDSESIEFASS
jgi:serine/threonine protein kinase